MALDETAPADLWTMPGDRILAEDFSPTAPEATERLTREINQLLQH